MGAAGPPLCAQLLGRGSPHPRCSRVLMLKPRVGEMVSMSSPLNFFRMVVLPALSRPLGQQLRSLGGGASQGREVTCPRSPQSFHKLGCAPTACLALGAPR